jgi:hypothetical protein
MTLRDAIDRARQGTATGWLVVRWPKDLPCTLDTEAQFGILPLNSENTPDQAGPPRRKRVSYLRVLLLLVAALVLFCGILILCNEFLVSWDGEPRSPRSACIANLKQIHGAKDQWALEHKRLPTDTPADTDLFGRDRYIFVKPVCREGGTYTLGAVAEKPACSIAGHTY